MGLTFEEPVAMDGRGRLAQSLKPKLGRRAAAGARLNAHAWTRYVFPASVSRGFRPLRRAYNAIIEFKAPRGAGSSAAALLLLASASYGAVKGDHVADIVAQVQDICDAAANSAGFNISEVALAGEREVSREDILAAAGITGRSSLLFLDAARTRARLLNNPWIAEATVLKLYPGRLRIEIKERDAFALWQKGGRVALISADGTVLEPFVPRRFGSLPQVVGTGAERAAQDFLALIARYPVIARQVDASVLVAERRWNLRLKGGIDVLLPESEPEQALRMLVDLDRAKKLLARDIAAVDLRLTDRVTVRLSDTASAARDAALKAAEKNRKSIRKGGEA
jgi:cell division protein FtsQ